MPFEPTAKRCPVCRRKQWNGDPMHTLDVCMRDFGGRYEDVMEWKARCFETGYYDLAYAVVRAHEGQPAHEGATPAELTAWLRKEKASV